MYFICFNEINNYFLIKICYIEFFYKYQSTPKLYLQHLNTLTHNHCNLFNLNIISKTILYILGSRFKNTRLSIFNDKTSLIINEWKLKETFFPSTKNYISKGFSTKHSRFNIRLSFSLVNLH